MTVRKCFYCGAKVSGLCVCPGAHEARERQAAQAQAALEAKAANPSRAGLLGREAVEVYFSDTEEGRRMRAEFFG